MGDMNSVKVTTVVRNSAVKLFESSLDVQALAVLLRGAGALAAVELPPDCTTVDCSRMAMRAIKRLSDNPYGTLGCPPGCPPPVIKKAYRQLVLQYHPDKSRFTIAIFHAVQAAYEELNTKHSPSSHVEFNHSDPYSDSCQQSKHEQRAKAAEAEWDKVREEVRLAEEGVRNAAHRQQEEARRAKEKDARRAREEEARSSELKEGRSSELKEGRSSELKEGRSRELKEGRSSELKEGKSSEPKRGRSSELKEGRSSELKEGKSSEPKKGKSSELKEGRGDVQEEAKSAAESNSGAGYDERGVAEKRSQEEARKARKAKVRAKARRKIQTETEGKAKEMAAGERKRERAKERGRQRAREEDQGLVGVEKGQGGSQSEERVKGQHFEAGNEAEIEAGIEGANFEAAIEGASFEDRIEGAIFEDGIKGANFETAIEGAIFEDGIEGAVFKEQATQSRQQSETQPTVQMAECVSILVEEGPLGIAVSFAEKSAYEMKFDYFTGKGPSESLAAGRLQRGMVLLQVDERDLRGKSFLSIQSFLQHRPVKLVFGFFAASDPPPSMGQQKEVFDCEGPLEASLWR
jgi:hypothetical protein